MQGSSRDHGGAAGVAITGLIALAVAMGIGRFAFTPIMPMMEADAGLTLRAAGWLAAANYLGYFLGALCAARLPPRLALRGGLLLIAWVTFAMVIAALGSMNSSILSGARVPYAMARDGIFFKVADGIHPKYRTPGRALIFQGILASIMALTGTFEELTNLFIFAGWIFYGLAVVALFRLRRTEPDLPRPYRCWGYPWVPGIFVAGALALTVSLWLDRPGRSSIGLLLIIAGLPFYRWWSRSTHRGVAGS